jgi:hypothetical protein
MQMQIEDGNIDTETPTDNTFETPDEDIDKVKT